MPHGQTQADLGPEAQASLASSEEVGRARGLQEQGLPGHPGLPARHLTAPHGSSFPSRGPELQGPELCESRWRQRQGDFLLHSGWALQRCGQGSFSFLSLMFFVKVLLREPVWYLRARAQSVCVCEADSPGPVTASAANPARGGAQLSQMRGRAPSSAPQC